MRISISFFSRFKVLESRTLWFGTPGHRTAFFHISPAFRRKFKVGRRSSLNSQRQKTNYKLHLFMGKKLPLNNLPLNNLLSNNSRNLLDQSTFET